MTDLKLVTFINDDYTPSGLRLVVSPSEDYEVIRYQRQGFDPDHTFYEAYSILDLVAQNTPARGSLHSKSLILERYFNLLEKLTLNLYKPKPAALTRVLELQLNILIQP